MQSKIDSVLEKLSKEELCAFAKEYARVNEGFAMALIERYWMPDATDYREMVEKCFMHPRKGSRYGEALETMTSVDDTTSTYIGESVLNKRSLWHGRMTINGYATSMP